MSQSINLIPQSEVTEQTKEKVIKLSTALSVIVLFLIIGLSGFFYYYTNKLKKDLAAKDRDIKTYQNGIDGLAEIEATARNLEAKYNKLKGIFDNDAKYSFLLRELKLRSSGVVSIQNLSFGLNDTINVTGDGDNYISIAKFIKNVNDLSFSSASKGMGGLFTGISLNTVSLENRTNKAQFFIVINYNRKLLIK